MMIGKISLMGGGKSQSLLAEVRSELMNSWLTEEISYHLKIYRRSGERQKWTNKGNRENRQREHFISQP